MQKKNNLKMLINPHLNNKCCSTSEINNLLQKIDQTIMNLSVTILNNIRFGLTNEVSENTYTDLILYKNVIVSKIMGNETLQSIPWITIISKVKNIINKQN